MLFFFYLEERNNIFNKKFDKFVPKSMRSYIAEYGNLYGYHQEHP
jgi:hypothetical protein